ncbi:MAG: S8 family serine peptidase [Lewinellaceae bacterium]|nr:S8 family serine peptidase [Saprospiraceae bacterium]MCB9354618.1 S8 family serine peptidase [Lewinellaceae bacterium]
MPVRIAFCLIFLFPALLLAQQKKKFWVEFTDKNNSPYCTCRPAAFLSAASLERRAHAGIPVLEEDLPVNPAYLDGLRNAGVSIHLASRWLNAAAITADSVSAMRLLSLPYVKDVRYIGRHIPAKNPPNRPPKKRVPVLAYPKPEEAGTFGYSGLQNSLLNLPPLYLAGHRGAGIRIAVMDGGFTNVDTLPFFDSVALQGRLFPGWDFVERDGAVYESAQHGTSVLSVMAGNLPGYFVGGAPDATYFLLKTEDTGGEYPIEEANWVAGAEWADSIGAHIVNASLGYTVFNDTSLNHRYKTLDGHTAIGSRGAAIAARKGMIICNSAGNEGDGPWRHIGVPADAPGLIAVGAVDYQGERASFSSLGPAADGRIKPDLMAPGDQVVTAGGSGVQLGLSSGTSLASPMLSGALAALWSAYPDKTAKEILDAVFASADQDMEPDNKRGYGLPDMTRAWLELGGYQTYAPNGRPEYLFAFNRDAGMFDFLIFSDQYDQDSGIELLDPLGHPVKISGFRIDRNGISTLHVNVAGDLPAGAYQVVLRNSGGVEHLLGLVWK